MAVMSTHSVLLIIRQERSDSRTQAPGACFFCLQRGVESQEELWHLPVRGLVQQKVGARVETPWGKKTRFQ